MAQLGEAFSFDSRRVNTLNSIDKSGTYGKQVAVVVDPHLYSSGLQALTEFLDKGVVATIHIGISFGAHDGYFHFFFCCDHKCVDNFA